MGIFLPLFMRLDLIEILCVSKSFLTLHQRMGRSTSTSLPGVEVLVFHLASGDIWGVYGVGHFFSLLELGDTGFPETEPPKKRELSLHH
jgi:hypothetical protein